MEVGQYSLPLLRAARQLVMEPGAGTGTVLIQPLQMEDKTVLESQLRT